MLTMEANMSISSSDTVLIRTMVTSALSEKNSHVRTRKIISTINSWIPRGSIMTSVVRERLPRPGKQWRLPLEGENIRYTIWPQEMNVERSKTNPDMVKSMIRMRK